MFEADVSNRELAEALKVHEAQVSRWRNGLHTPVAPTCAAIAGFLAEKLGHDCPVSELWPDAPVDDRRAA